MAFDSQVGANKMANVLSARMKEESAQPLVLDFGQINGDYSLTTNTFPVNIPKGDYSVCNRMTGNVTTIEGGSHEGHTSGDGSHSHTLSGGVVKPGDRVLVAWVQNEAVVIDVIVSSERI